MNLNAIEMYYRRKQRLINGLEAFGETEVSKEIERQLLRIDGRLQASVDAAIDDCIERLQTLDSILMAEAHKDS